MKSCNQVCRYVSRHDSALFRFSCPRPIWGYVSGGFKGGRSLPLLNGRIWKQVKIWHEKALFLYKIFSSLDSTLYSSALISNFWIRHWATFVLFGLLPFTMYKCTKHQFIRLLTAILKNSHIENSKNHKRWYCPHHTDCVSMCCWIISPFVIFAVFDVRVL